MEKYNALAYKNRNKEKRNIYIIVPIPNKTENKGHQKNCSGIRQHYTHKRAYGAAPVKIRRILKLGRHTLVWLPEKINKQSGFKTLCKQSGNRGRKQGIYHRYSRSRRKLWILYVKRHWYYLRRNNKGEKRHKEKDCPALEFKPCKPVPGNGARKHLKHRANWRQKQCSYKRRGESRFLNYKFKIIER